MTEETPERAKDRLTQAWCDTCEWYRQAIMAGTPCPGCDGEFEEVKLIRGDRLRELVEDWKENPKPVHPANPHKQESMSLKYRTDVEQLIEDHE